MLRDAPVACGMNLLAFPLVGEIPWEWTNPQRWVRHPGQTPGMDLESILGPRNQRTRPSGPSFLFSL